MIKTQDIPAEIMAEAERAAGYHGFENQVRSIARALLARDTAARKECAEIAREAQQERRHNRLDAHPDLSPYHLWAEQQAKNIATAIEETITGGGDG